MEVSFCMIKKIYTVVVYDEGSYISCYVGRDIKGANILVDPNGRVKLADFGMAKHVSALLSLWCVCEHGFH